MLNQIAHNLQTKLNQNHPSTILLIPNRFKVTFRPEEQLFSNRPPIASFIKVCDLETGTQFHFSENFIVDLISGSNPKPILEQIYSLIKIGKPVTRRLSKTEKHFGIIEPDMTTSF